MYQANPQYSDDDARWFRNVETVTDEDGEEREVCGTCYCDPCCCQQVIDQGAGDD